MTHACEQGERQQKESDFQLENIRRKIKAEKMRMSENSDGRRGGV